MRLPNPFECQTARCRLRIPNESDFPHIWSATRHPGFNDGMPWNPPTCEAEMLEPLARQRKGWEEGTGYSFTAETVDGAFVGRVALWQDEGVWSLGYWIHPDQQRLGYATELAEEMLVLAFHWLEVPAVEALYATWNEPSGKILRRLGMVEIEHIPEGFQKHGRWVSEYRMRIERDVWLSPRQPGVGLPTCVNTTANEPE